MTASTSPGVDVEVDAAQRLRLAEGVANPAGAEDG